MLNAGGERLLVGHVDRFFPQEAVTDSRHNSIVPSDSVRQTYWAWPNWVKVTGC
jgi:hypothetical protein